MYIMLCNVIEKSFVQIMLLIKNVFYAFYNYEK